MNFIIMESIGINDIELKSIFNECDPIEEAYRIPLENPSVWKKHLEEEGFVVVSGVLSEEKSQRYLIEMLKCVGELSEGKFKYKDKKTWSSAKNFPYVMHGGMIQYVGHAQFQWDLREEVAETFATLWEVDKYSLASSFDGFCFMAGQRTYRSRPDNSFLHSDQSPLREGLWSYQGLINLLDCDSQSGGFVCIPKTHLSHRTYFETRHDLSDKKLKGDWYIFTDEEKQKESFLNDTIKINCKAGDLILWDSRIFHCNTVPTKKVARACTYICMLPKSHVKEDVIKKRKKAFEDKRVSTHHPASGFRTFPTTPRFVDAKLYKKLILKVSNPKLSDLQRSLACID